MKSKITKIVVTAESLGTDELKQQLEAALSDLPDETKQALVAELNQAQEAISEQREFVGQLIQYRP